MPVDSSMLLVAVPQIAKALKELAGRIENKGFDFISKVLDENGNSVGTVETFD